MPLAVTRRGSTAADPTGRPRCVGRSTGRAHLRSARRRRRRRDHPHRGPHEDLPGRGEGRRQPRPVGAARRDLRAAGAERRRQDDHRRDADVDGGPDRRPRARGRRRRDRTPRVGKAGDRRRAADQHPRPLADRLGEPVLPRQVLRDERTGREARGDPLLERFLLTDRGLGRGAGAVGRHGPAAHGGAGGDAPARDPLPRRAHRRARPAGPHRALADPRGAAHRGADHPAHDALHGRSRRAVRPRRDHGPRPHPRPRPPRSAEAQCRGRHDRDRFGRRPARRARPAPRSAACRT